MMTSDSIRRAARVGMAWAAVALATPVAARADFTVERGWDLFSTVKPTTTFAGIAFEGVPLGTFDFTTGTGGDFGRGIGVQSVFNADTIVKRLSTVTVLGANNVGTTPIELVALNLRTTAPVDFGLGTDIYYETLQSQRRTGEGTPFLSSGTLSIFFGLEGDPHGTYSTTLTVNFDLRKGSPTGPIAQSLTEHLISPAPGLTNEWGHNPMPPNALQIEDVNAFLKRTPGHPADDDRSRDFWPRGGPGGLLIIFDVQDPAFQPPLPGVTIHAFTTAVPEPASLVLFGTGTLGVIGYGWRRRRAA